jgi:hypothetical protein
LLCWQNVSWNQSSLTWIYSGKIRSTYSQVWSKPSFTALHLALPPSPSLGKGNKMYWLEWLLQVLCFPPPTSVALWGPVPTYVSSHSLFSWPPELSILKGTHAPLLGIDQKLPAYLSVMLFQWLSEMLAETICQYLLWVPRKRKT